MGSLTQRTGLRKLWEIVKDREAWHAAVHGAAKMSDMTERLKNNNLSPSKFPLSTTLL